MATLGHIGLEVVSVIYVGKYEPGRFPWLQPLALTFLGVKSYNLNYILLAEVMQVYVFFSSYFSPFFQGLSRFPRSLAIFVKRINSQSIYIYSSLSPPALLLALFLFFFFSFFLCKLGKYHCPSATKLKRLDGHFHKKKALRRHVRVTVLDSTHAQLS